MTRTPSMVSQDILAKLAITDSSLSFELGTPERKIIDAVAEEISSAEIDNAVTSQNWDIDSLTGTDLEQFVGLFGFGRLIGQYASGVITFSVSAVATSAIQFPVGTQAYTSGTDVTTQIYFSTTSPASIAVGATSTSVPVTATVTGVVGNVTANSITGYTTSIGNIMVNNVNPCIGGTDPETDDQLRARFKATFMRNIAGTKDFYSALCVQQDTVSQVKVMGPINQSTEQLQIVNGAATSTLANSQYTWSNGELLSQNFGATDEVVFNPGVDYTFSTTVPPVVTVLNATNIPNGTILDLQYQYIPSESRNNPANSITNKIDIFVDGQDVVQVTEQAIISSQTLNTTTGDPYSIAMFQRPNNTHPVSGHRFQRLGSCPIVTPPQTILVNGITYHYGTDYTWLTYDYSTLMGSIREIAGIEWLTSSPPAAGQATTLTYTYNRVPETLQDIVNQTKQITSDPLIHQAKYTAITVNMVMVYSSGYTPSAVDAAASAAVSAFFANSGYGPWLQFSDIEAVVHAVAGVDNCRITVANDGVANYGLQQLARDGVTVINVFTNDQPVYDAQLVKLVNFQTTRRSTNTFQAA